PPREAARKAMDEVTGPVIAVALVLCAVFVPCAFIGGITGQFFRQFAVTISASTVFSAFNSLTLSPALAAILLKPHGARRDPLTWLLDKGLGWFFRGFNAAFGAATAAYTRAVGVLLRGSAPALAAAASNSASRSVSCAPFEQRRTPDRGGNAIMARMRRECAKRVRDGVGSVFGAPPIPGLSVASGFKLMVEDRSDLGTRAL